MVGGGNATVEAAIAEASEGRSNISDNQND